MTEKKTYPSDESLESKIYTHKMLWYLREPVVQGAIQCLNLPAGSCGLDVGCGIGHITQLLADAIWPDGRVTGVDLSPDYLKHAKDNIATHRKGRIYFQEGDINQLPLDNAHFDWVFSSDTLWPGPKEMGCPSEDPISMVKALARVVKPGGLMALLFWSSQKLLPGYPLLEARLNTTCQATAPFKHGMKPKQHVLRALTWFREAGLVEIKARSFIAEVCAPLSDNLRKALSITFQMIWGDAEKEISQADWAAFNRLSQPESSGFILNHPDYYGFVTYTLFYGKIAR